jgi:hypothetical protein
LVKSPHKTSLFQKDNGPTVRRASTTITAPKLRTMVGSNWAWWFSPCLNSLSSSGQVLAGQVYLLEEITPKRLGLTLSHGHIDAFAAELRSALLNGDMKERRDYLHLILSRVIIKGQEIQLVGNKRVLTQAYAQDWQAAALTGRA